MRMRESRLDVGEDEVKDLSDQSLECLVSILSNIMRKDSPLSRGNGCISSSWEFRYRDDPCDFFDFFFIDLLANGSMRSTNVLDDMIVFNQREEGQFFFIQNPLFSEFLLGFVMR